MFDKEINEIPEYEMVPGTVQLVDVTGTWKWKRTVTNPISFCNHHLRKILTIHCAGANGKERIQFFLLFIWSFLQSSTSNFTGPLYDAFVEALDVTYQDISNTAALCFTGLGWELSLFNHAQQNMENVWCT